MTSERVERAVDLFGKSFNCSQSVFFAFAGELGLDRETALKIASPFGGGVARSGGTCGAVSGGLLALGLAVGATEPARKEEGYRISQEFMNTFARAHGSLVCRELIGCDISTPEGWQKAKQSGKFTGACPVFVREAVEIVERMLEANG
jgi:C_GCAxxG_C_C family probable redox protein